MDKRFALIPLSLLAGTLGACADMHARPQSAAASPAPVTVTLPDQQSRSPRVALSTDALYDILVGEIAGQRGDIKTAVNALSRAAAKTRDPRLAERATGAALYAKDYELAHRDAALWIAAEPNNAEAREAMAEADFGLNRPDQAEQQFKDMIAASSGNLDQAYLRIAAVLARQPDQKRALAVMHRCVALHPKEAGAQFALAHLAVRQGDLEIAAKAIDEALQERPDWDEAAIFKARILISAQDPQKAQAFYQAYLSAHPSATAMRLSYARYLIDLKQWDKALREFKHVADANPQDVDSIYAVGLLALQTNQLNEAETYLKRALALQPDNDQCRLYLGQLAEERKHYAEALRRYHSIDSGQYHFEAQVRAGLVTAKEGHVDAAIDQLQAIEPDSREQRVQTVLAEDEILRQAKQYPRELKVLTSALAEIPDDTDLLYARALVAEKLNMLDLHERDLRRLLQLDPKNANAMNALGYTLADRTNRYQEAYKLISQALALKPDDPYIMDSMGWVYYRMGNTHKAVEYLRRALAIRNDAEISAHLGEVLWVSGDRAAAETIWTRALRETPDNEALLAVIKKFKH